MVRFTAFALGLMLALLSSAVLLAETAAAQRQLDVCYYDSSGKQHDADWCVVGGDLSAKRTMHLATYCRADAGAVCEIGRFGDCKTGANKYSHYVIFPHMSGQCPTTYSAALGTGHGGGAVETVAPTCPSGYVLSGSNCVRDAAPAPSCPDGYSFSNGQCVSIAAPAPAPAASDCRPAYNACMVRAGQIVHPRENFEMETACQHQLDACNGKAPSHPAVYPPARSNPPPTITKPATGGKCLGRGRACRSTSACCAGLTCQEASPDVGGGWQCQPRSGGE